MKNVNRCLDMVARQVPIEVELTLQISTLQLTHLEVIHFRIRYLITNRQY